MKSVLRRVLIPVVAVLAGLLPGVVMVDQASALTKLSQAQAESLFRAVGITWSSSGGCTNRNVSTCTSFAQINDTTVYGARTLKTASENASVRRVAAGALAFEGVESILHGFGHGGYGFGGTGYGMGAFGMGERPVEVINNYYDEPGRGAEHGEHHLQDGIAGYNPRDNDANDNLRGFDNASSTGDQDTRAFADASRLDDPSAFDDQNLDDGSGDDDSGTFDDGGGFDSGSGDF